jgi:hypothetical protein
MVEAQVAIAMSTLEVAEPIEFHSLIGSHPGGRCSSLEAGWVMGIEKDLKD